MARVQVAKAGWYINPVALRGALSFLGLTLPVQTRFSSGRWTTGTHRTKFLFQDDGFSPYRGTVHRITLSQIIQAGQANETLWHELIHAQQTEQWAASTGKTIGRFYREAYTPAKGQWGASYKENRYEVDCRERAGKLHLAGLLGKTEARLIEAIDPEDSPWVS